MMAFLHTNSTAGHCRTTVPSWIFSWRGSEMANLYQPSSTLSSSRNHILDAIWLGHWLKPSNAMALHTRWVHMAFEKKHPHQRFRLVQLWQTTWPTMTIDGRAGELAPSIQFSWSHSTCSLFCTHLESGCKSDHSSVWEKKKETGKNARITMRSPILKISPC